MPGSFPDKSHSLHGLHGEAGWNRTFWNFFERWSGKTLLTAQGCAHECIDNTPSARRHLIDGGLFYCNSQSWFPSVCHISPSAHGNRALFGIVSRIRSVFMIPQFLPFPNPKNPPESQAEGFFHKKSKPVLAEGYATTRATKLKRFENVFQ